MGLPVKKEDIKAVQDLAKPGADAAKYIPGSLIESMLGDVDKQLGLQAVAPEVAGKRTGVTPSNAPSRDIAASPAAPVAQSPAAPKNLDNYFATPGMGTGEEEPAQPSRRLTVDERLRAMSGDPYAEIRESPPESLAAEKQGLADYKDSIQKTIDAAQADKRVDLSPFLNLTDSWTGSNTAKGYRGPMSTLEQAKNAEELKKKFQDQINKYGENEAKFLASYGAGKLYGSALRAQETEATRNQRVEGEVIKDFGSLGKDLMHDTKTIRSAEFEINQGTYQGVQRAISGLARMVGQSGALTEADIQLPLPQNYERSWAGIQQWFTSGDVTLTPQLLAGLRATIANSKRNTALNYAEQAGLKREGYASAGAYAPLFKSGQSGDKLFRRYLRGISSFSGIPEAELYKRDAEMSGNQVPGQPTAQVTNPNAKGPSEAVKTAYATSVETLKSDPTNEKALRMFNTYNQTYGTPTPGSR